MNNEMQVDVFIKAAKTNDRKVIDYYLDSGFNINERDEYGFTAIIEAAEFGHEELFWDLIERNADIMIKTYENYSVLHAIGLGGNRKMLGYAESKGLSIYEKISKGEQKGMDTLDYAQMANNKEILEELINRRGKIV